MTEGINLSVTEFSILGGFILSCALACTGWFKSKLTDMKTLLDAEIKPLVHKLNNQQMKLDALEKKSDDKEARLIRVETAVENFEKGQELLRQEVKESRIHLEAKLDKKFDALAQSIREIRDVKPK